MAKNVNIKSQEQIGREFKLPTYVNPDTKQTFGDIEPVDRSKARENQRSLKEDTVESFKVGIKDIDEAIHYYFNNVLRPQVSQNGKRINVPVVYGSPERWAAMQKDGYYRDKNGKMQAPLIVFRRTSLEKNRNLGNKLDGNGPRNFGTFKKTYSRKNAYDKFDLLNNRKPVDEYYLVAIPDYVDITYDCMIYTDYLEQNNKIIESINFASDSYWGDPEKFRFRAMIDSYSTSTDLAQGNDRMNKTQFQIKLLGHIIPDSINAHAFNNQKVFSKASVKVTSEVESTTNS